MCSSESTKNFVVYIDDDPDDLMFVKESLAHYEETLEVITFQKSPEGYNYLLNLENAGRKPCLIILDINMPALSGKELLQALRVIPFYDETPIILFTTSNSQNDEQFALLHKAGFVSKPMNAVDMKLIADEFLNHCSDRVRTGIKG